VERPISAFLDDAGRAKARVDRVAELGDDDEITRRRGYLALLVGLPSSHEVRARLRSLAFAADDDPRSSI